MCEGAGLGRRAAASRIRRRSTAARSPAPIHRPGWGRGARVITSPDPQFGSPSTAESCTRWPRRAHWSSTSRSACAPGRRHPRAVPQPGGGARGSTCAHAAATAAAGRSSGRLFSEWMEKSRADLAMLDYRDEHRPLSLCRHPWSRPPSAAGRDVHHRWQVAGAIDSRGRGVLPAHLAAPPGAGSHSFRDSAPARSCTRRGGEMARWARCPSAATTGRRPHPAVVALAGRLSRAHRRNGADRGAVAAAAGRASAGSRPMATPTADGMSTMPAAPPAGMGQQGCEGSQDRSSTTTGGVRKPERSALGGGGWIEVQGATLRRLRAMAAMARRRGPGQTTPAPGRQGARIRPIVEQTVWMEDEGTTPSRGRGRPALPGAHLQTRGHLLSPAWRAAAGAQAWPAR